MIQDCVIGIDVGTTGTKAVLFSRRMEPLAQAYRSYPIETGSDGRSEQDAMSWWRAVVETVRHVVSKLPPSETVASIALSVQGGTIVPTDEKFRPLRPAIVWNDTRGRRQIVNYQDRYPNGSLYRKTGWPAGPGQPLMMLAWLRENEPELFRQARYFLSVHDFLSAQLTGRPAVDLSNAGINQLVDIENASYDESLLDFAGVRAEQLAELLPSGRPIGYLTAEAASQLGLTPETVLVSGAHDQYAAALGAGVLPGEVLVGSGTAWVLTCLDNKPHFELDLPQSRAAIPGLWGTVASITTGGICLEWFRDQLLNGSICFQELDRLASQSPPGADGIRFYPYFSGSPKPLPNPDAAGTLLGLRLSHSRWDIARSFMEGVVFQLTWLLHLLKETFPVESLRLSGGAAKSAFWTEILANVTGLPVTLPLLPDLPCAGTAVLAGCSAGLFTLENIQKAMRVSGPAVEPDPALSAQYQELLAEYIACTPAVDSIYRPKGGTYREFVSSNRL